MKKINFTEEQLQDVFDLYQNKHWAMHKIGTKYGVSKTVIGRILKENNIDIKSSNHHYYADYRKFQTIDTPEKAYWLGFIAADGCVQKRAHTTSIVISIHQKDREHLEKFKVFMDSNVNITDFINASGYSANNPTPMSKIIFNSKDMGEDFIAHGIVPRKSLILEPPKIDKQFYLPYILGYFDGDGTIFKFNHDKEFAIGFVGTLPTITWINEILDMSSTIEQRQEGTDTYYIRVGGTQKPYLLLKRLYDSVDTHLERKYLLFKELERVVLGRNTK